MLTVNELCPPGTPAEATLTLTSEQRRRSRFRAVLDDGRDVSLYLPRGTVLRDGDRLRTTTALVIAVAAAKEKCSTVRTADPRRLARACYHLGNRHIAVEVGDGWARYLHDHVLDHMCVELGLEVLVEPVAFEPETGAYGGHGHAHGPES